MKTALPINARRVGWTADVTDETPFADLHARKFGRDETIVLVDGRGMAYRAYHSKQILQTSRGDPTAALFGTLETLGLLMQAANTSMVCVVWDGNVRYKRALHPSYKSRHDRERTREEQAEHDRSQKSISICRRTLDALGIPSLCVNELEADDSVGLLAFQAAEVAKRAAERGVSFPKRILIAADDRDYYQLADPGVNRHGEILIWRTGYGEAIDAAELFKRTGLRPDQWADYKALVGESSTGDDIPGVEGFGEKTAIRTIATHGNLEAAIAYAKKAVRGPKATKTERTLAAGEKDARLSYQLARITKAYTDLDVYKIPQQPVRIATVDAMKRAVVERTIDPAYMQRILAMYEINSLSVPSLMQRLGFANAGAV